MTLFINTLRASTVVPLLSVGLLATPVALADVGSRIWATGGVTTIEGSAGGGLVPWALLGSYADDEEWGGTVALSRADVDDYSLSVTGAGLNWNNRVEVTVARQTLDRSQTIVYCHHDGLYPKSWWRSRHLSVNYEPQSTAGRRYHCGKYPPGVFPEAPPASNLAGAMTRAWHQ